MSKELDDKIQELEELIQNLQQTKTKVEELSSKSIDDIAGAGTLIAKEYEKIITGIKEAYDKQYEFLSARELATEVQIKLIEKEKEERQKLITVQRERLQLTKRLLSEQENVEKSDRRRVERLKEVQDRIDKINDAIKAQSNAHTRS